MELNEALKQLVDLFDEQPTGRALVCLPHDRHVSRAMQDVLAMLSEKGKRNFKGRHMPAQLIRFNEGGRIYFRHGQHDGVAMRGVHVDRAAIIDVASLAHPAVMAEFERSTEKCDPKNVFYCS